MFRNYVFTLCVLSLLVLGQTVTAHAADSCQPIVDAVIKLATTPSHSYSIQTAPLVNGQQRKVEVIYLQGKTYMLANGKWMLSPVTSADVVKEEMENEKSGESVCKFERNESVNGEAAAVYSMRRKVDTVNEDGLIWISQKSGLLLREEIDRETGGTQGKTHFIERYEYSNVKPPM